MSLRTYTSPIHHREAFMSYLNTLPQTHTGQFSCNGRLFTVEEMRREVEEGTAIGHHMIWAHCGFDLPV